MGCVLERGLFLTVCVLLCVLGGETEMEGMKWRIMG